MHLFLAPFEPGSRSAAAACEFLAHNGYHRLFVDGAIVETAELLGRAVQDVVQDAGQNTGQDAGANAAHDAAIGAASEDGLDGMAGGITQSAAPAERNIGEPLGGPGAERWASR